MRVFVAGATGVIGRRLVPALLDEGHQVTAMVRSPDQEIVYRDIRLRTYREFRERIGRLASGLSQIGVERGDVVAVLEWDSDRYHECYFAVPMMGAVMQTVNMILPPEDIAYIIK